MADAGRTGILKGVVEGLTKSPPYLFAFGMAFLLSTSGALLAGNNPWVAGVMIGGALALGAFALWMVEKGNTLVRTNSPEQASRIAGLTDRETAIHDVLEGLVKGDGDSYFVYSSSLVNEFLTHEGTVNPYKFREDEKVVTTIRDAWGIAMVHGLLHLGGKEAKSIEIITAKEFNDKCWGANLILIGSGFANPKTEAALKNFRSPLRFSSDRAHIVSAPAAAGEPELQWPEPGAADDFDYGLIVKLKLIKPDVERVYFVLAGLGPTGTLAACYYLTDQITKLHERFKTSPFGLVVRVKKDLGYASTEMVPGSDRAIAPTV